jgi:hypothetical protein
MRTIAVGPVAALGKVALPCTGASAALACTAALPRAARLIAFRTFTS